MEVNEMWKMVSVEFSPHAQNPKIISVKLIVKLDVSRRMFLHFLVKNEKKNT